MSIDPTPLENAIPPARKLHLLYHEIREKRSDYSYVIERNTFQEHLDLYADLLAAKSPVTPVITFDDGHESDYVLAAPLIAHRGLSAHFFITAGWTSTRPGYMDWSQIRSLQQAGHSIGAHGWSHIFLTHCTPAQLQIELSRARLTLEDHLGVSITTMSFPGGRANGRVLQACRAAGYSRVFTSAPRSESVPLGFAVGRLNIRGDMNSDWLAQLLAPSSPLLARIGRKHRFKAAVQSVLGDHLYARLWSVANRQEHGTGSDAQSGPDGAFPASRQEPRA